MYYSPIFDKNKVNILVVEHATPEFPHPKGKCLLGDLNVPLSEKGQEEALQLKQLIEKSKITFDRIYSSDLQRAYDTAAILSQGSDTIVQKRRELRETNKGDLQGLIREEYQTKTSYKIYKGYPSAKERFFVPMGSGNRVETKADLALRLIPLINEIRNDKTLSGKTILIVTHGNPWKVIDTLSKNPSSLDPSKNLKDTLTTIPEYSDPKSCDVFLFTADSNSFEGKGKLQFNQEGMIESTSY